MLVPKSTKKIKKIYLDYAASVIPNPSSLHELGVGEKKKLENARKEVADVLFTQPENIIFTSGGTERNNLAIQGVIASCLPNFSSCALPRVRGGTLGVKNLKDIPHIITTNIEHSSVLETCKMLERRGMAEISIVPVELSGIVDPKKIKNAIKENTILVSVMYANNEIGTIQPIKEIAKEIRHYRKNSAKDRPSQNCEGWSFASCPLFHTDAVQAVNYLDLNVEKLGIDLMTLTGSKIEEVGKAGMLYKRKNVQIANIFGGGNQEMGLRPGTENVAEILKFSSALAHAQKIKEKESERLIKLRDYFINKLLNSKILQGYGIILNGDSAERLPNNVNITIPKIPSDLLVIELSARGVMTSSKSACKSSEKGGSYVISAIRPTADSEIGGLRFSFGRNTKKEDIDYTLKAFVDILTKLKKWYN